MQHLTVGIALFAGAASFVSPCCLPLYPSYLSYITGVSVNRLKTESSGEIRRKTVLHTLCFIAGFSIIFYSLGLSAGLVADLFIKNRVLLRQLAALLIFCDGIVLAGHFFSTSMVNEGRQIPMEIKACGVCGFSAGRNGLCRRMVPLCRAHSWGDHHFIGDGVRSMAAAHDSLFPWLRGSFFFILAFFYRFHQVDFELFQHDYENRRGPHARHGRAAVHRPNDTDHHLAAGENSRMAEVLK